jgi:ribonuclease E
MTRKMLINAQGTDELRMAIANDSVLEHYQFDFADAGLTQGNIYRGRIARIEPSLDAAFIDYGVEKHGFLASQDVVEKARYKQPKGNGRPRIGEVLEAGQPIVVQIRRDPEGKKGAALTTNLSIAGRYLVLTPFDSARGVSRKVDNEAERKVLKKLARSLEIPDGCGAVVRTNAREQSMAALNRDLAALLRLWNRIFDEATKEEGIRLLYGDQDMILKALRDYLDNSVEEILVDDVSTFEKTESYLRAFMPRAKIKLEHYRERLPLFSRFGLEQQIENIHKRTVPLPSGGSIVIDGTEALTAIDINSGRSTQAKTQEETAVHTNLEAAEEVARQLRLRDIGGLIVIDFIDMRTLKHRNQVEKTLQDALKIDKARSSVSKISRNGLLEVNRQRIRQALQLRSFSECPLCVGRGRVPSPELSSQRLLHRIQARAATGLMRSLKVSLHPEMADSFQNHRRRELVALEDDFDLHVVVSGDASLSFAGEEMEWTARSMQERAEAKAVEAVEMARVVIVGGLEEGVEMVGVVEEEEEEAAEKAPARRPSRRRRPRRRRSGGSPKPAAE